jgi:pyruvate kinase
MPLEKVPGVQKEMTRACRRAGKPVVVATQMLESMIQPGADARRSLRRRHRDLRRRRRHHAVGGIGAGQYPVEAVATMNRIAEEVERDRPICRRSRAAHRARGDRRRRHRRAARQVAETLDLSAIVCWTSSGSTGMRVARERPKPPIVAISPEPRHRAQAVGGVGRPLRRRRGRARSGRHGRARLPHRLSRTAPACRSARRIISFAKAGQRVIIVAGVPLGTTNMMRPCP